MDSGLAEDGLVGGAAGACVPVASRAVPIDPSAGRAPARRLRRLGLVVLLALVATLAVALLLLFAVLRRELRARADRDTRPCPACRSPAIHGGHALLDEQGHRLLFATPEEAAAYAADYAKP